MERCLWLAFMLISSFCSFFTAILTKTMKSRKTNKNMKKTTWIFVLSVSNPEEFVVCHFNILFR